MEVLKAIYQRRAVRDFSDASISKGVVLDLLQAAVQAPSAMNLQPWAFAVFHGRERLLKYSQRAKDHLLATSERSFSWDPRIDQYTNVAANLFHGADTLILVCAKPNRFQPVEDCFLAAQNLMLAAHDRGLGTCPVGFARSWFNLPEVKTELGIPPHYEAVLPIVLGHPLHPPATVTRDQADIATWHWDDSP